jgi:surfeit locus 1 family protein
MNRSVILFRLRIGRFRLEPGLWPTLAAVILLPLLVGLGTWQVQRADYKRRLQDEYDRYQAEAPISLRSAMQGVEALRFHRLRARGRYEPERQILIDNRVHRGQAGYHLVTPLHIEGGAVRLLVNRGWVAAGPDRKPPPLDTPGGIVEVTGVAAVPGRPGLRLGPAGAGGPGWQPVWEYLDLADYSQAVAFPVLPVVLLLDPDSPAGGLVRQWARLDTGIQTHQGYALTWFSLAAALVIIYIVVNTRRADDADHSRPRH